jgi:hypothetical protein
MAWRIFLTWDDRDKIIRCSMSFKKKFTTSIKYDNLKAMLIDSGDQQDIKLYKIICLSSPTALTTSVLAIAAIAACKGRSVTVMDIKRAFLIADIANTRIKVHMRLSRVVMYILVHIDLDYARFVGKRCTFVVLLDKVLYGCVDAATLWHANLCTDVRGDRFVSNPYDPCVSTKQGLDNAQIMVLMHVDDLFITSKSNNNNSRSEK